MDIWRGKNDTLLLKEAYTLFYEFDMNASIIAITSFALVVIGNSFDIYLTTHETTNTVAGVAMSFANDVFKTHLYSS
jgi:hypothetical protein